MRQFSNQENFYKRLRELGNVESPSKSGSLENATLIEYARANDGSALGIIKENDSFYIKSSNVKGDNIGVENFTYIGGLENKLKYKYASLSEAVKTRNFYIQNINESLDRKFNPAKTLNEQAALATADSEIKDSDIVSDKTGGKGAPQAPVNDGNAKSKADKGTSQPSPLATADSERSVSTPTKKIAESEALATADSEIADGDMVANKQGGKEKPQAPVNDATAKTKADAGLKTPAAPSTEDSEIKDSDVVANKTTGKEKATAPINDTNAKSKADAGHSQPSPLATADSQINASVKTVQIAEAFGQEEELPVADAAPAQSAPETQAPTPAASDAVPAAGDEDASLDAAAQALDNLDITSSDVDGAAQGGAEAPVADAGAEAAPIDDAPASGTANAAIGDDAAVKDVEKLVGKTGQKVRTTELTPEMAGGFLKALLKSFDAKIPELDSDFRKELANIILKADAEGEESNGSPESAEPVDGGAEPEASSAPDFSGAEGSEEAGAEGEPDDKEIEEAINAHLSDMVNGEEGGETEVKPFKGYMAERGYDAENVNEVSIMEMVSLVSGYANECGDLSQADVKAIAEFWSPEVKEGVVECGFGTLAESVDTFSVKPKKYASKEPKVVAEEVVEEPKKNEIKFAPAGDSLIKKEDKKEDKKEEKKEEVSESVNKLKSIIKTKIQERLGLRKPSLSESSKSNLSKRIDAMINEEIKNNKDFLKKFNIK